jgi:hypothetical protein
MAYIEDSTLKTKVTYELHLEKYRQGLKEIRESWTQGQHK